MLKRNSNWRLLGAGIGMIWLVLSACFMMQGTAPTKVFAQETAVAPQPDPAGGNAGSIADIAAAGWLHWARILAWDMDMWTLPVHQ
jgi:hypothetical protein